MGDLWLPVVSVAALSLLQYAFFSWNRHTYSRAVAAAAKEAEDLAARPRDFTPEECANRPPVHLLALTTQVLTPIASTVVQAAAIRW